MKCFFYKLALTVSLLFAVFMAGCQVGAPPRPELPGPALEEAPSGKDTPPPTPPGIDEDWPASQRSQLGEVGSEERTSPAIEISESREAGPSLTVGNEVPMLNPGHAPDYSWLVGQLQYLHVRNVWRIRYALPESEDRYGGTATLVGHDPMTAFQAGQMVRVTGRFVDPNSREPSPAYQVQAIQPVP